MEPCLPTNSAVVVGASLSGLMTALALARGGIAVTLLERSDDTGRTGAAINVGRGSLDRLFGSDGRSRTRAPSPGVQSWSTVHASLMAAIGTEPRIVLHADTSIVAVGQDGEGAWAIAADGRRYAGDVLIGADGHRSVVRAKVVPAHPNASFAGYVIWLGVASEANLGYRGRWPTETDLIENEDGVFLGYPLPSAAGRVSPGDRQLGWAWYDARRNGLLRETGCVEGSIVRHSMRPEDVPEITLRQLEDEARSWLPAPWRPAVLNCLRRRSVTGTPIAEYVPDVLARGRIALVGDAAHVPTPMTGGGFGESLADAEALADVLTDAGRWGSIEAALMQYERHRLATVRSMVERGQSFSRAFAAKALT